MLPGLAQVLDFKFFSSHSFHFLMAALLLLLITFLELYSHFLEVQVSAAKLLALQVEISESLMQRGPAARKFVRKARYTCAPRIRSHPYCKQPPRKRCEVISSEIFNRTGIFEDTFIEYVDLIKPLVELPRGSSGPVPGRRGVPLATSLDTMSRVLLVLQYLREHPPYKALAREFSISVPQVSREIHHLLPIIYTTLNEIPTMIPEDLIPHPFEGVIGAIDCTPHYRWRVHPRQVDWYRGDKHAFFTTGE